MAAAMLKELFEQYSTVFAQYVFDGIRNIQNSTINTSKRDWTRNDKAPVTTSGQEDSEFRSVSA